MAWHERATIYYDWARYGEDLTPAYAEHVVQKTLDTHCDTLAFCVQLGGYALWDSTAQVKAPTIGDMDLIGEMAELCRKHGLHFVPWWLGTATGVERVLRVHPSWQLVGPPQDDGTQRKHNYICYNTPYRELLLEEVREVVGTYKPDGIYFDQLPGSCYCQWCQAKYEKRFGQPMPVVKDEFFVYNTAAGLPQNLRQFRDEAVRGFCAGVRKMIDEVSPSTIYAQNWVRNHQSYLGVGTVDVMMPEFYQRDDLLPLGMKHRLTKTHFDNGTIWGNVRHSTKHDARHHPLRGTRMLLVDCAANYASPLMLDLCAMDFDPTGTKELAATFDHIRAMQESLDGAETTRYAAVLHSRLSCERFRDRFEQAFEGAYRLMLEHHLPLEIVNEAGIQRGELKDYKVLVLPDAAALEPETVTAIREAVANGMGLVASFMTATGPGNPTSSLADLLGFEATDVTAYASRRGGSTDPVLNLPDMESEGFFHYASADPGHPFADGIADTTRMPFAGGFVNIRPTGDSQVIGWIHMADQARMNSRVFNRPGIFPGEARWPLGVTREVDGARLAYFACQADATGSRLDAPELETLMLRAIVWAGGTPPVGADDCPATVELRWHHHTDRNEDQAILVNLTISPLMRGGGWGVIRYVTPQRRIQLYLKTEKPVKEVVSLLGADVEWEQEGDTVTIVIDEVDLYDHLTVKY